MKNLLLYHTEDKNIAWRKALYLEEGRKYYSGNLYVPDDLEQLKLDEGEKIQLRDGREVVLREAEPGGCGVGDCLSQTDGSGDPFYGAPAGRGGFYAGRGGENPSEYPEIRQRSDAGGL